MMRVADVRAVEAARTRRVDLMTDALSRLTDAVDNLAGRVQNLEAEPATELRRAIGELDWTGRRRATFVRKARESAANLACIESIRNRVLAHIRKAARSGKPIVVGPWTGEVGFELLYWAPFVRWALERFRIDPERVTLLSRGGTASWYGVDGARYLDILELCSPDEFRQRTLKERKQRAVRAFDRALIRHARRRLGAMSLLHPALMYALFEPYWTSQASLRWVHDFATFERIVPAPVQGLELPRPYVAARFYFSKCFRNTPENQERVRVLIQSLARETNVVLLGSGVALDDHREVMAERPNRVYTVDPLMRPETNLAVQTAVIAGAEAFIGTYGGFAYLAPLCGVNAVALYSQRSFYPHHLDFAQHLFHAVGGGSLTVTSLGERV